MTWVIFMVSNCMKPGWSPSVRELTLTRVVKTNTGGFFRIKQKSKVQECFARVMPKVSHEHLYGHWSDKVEVEALLFGQLSVAIGNPKVKPFACVFVCFLFFYGYKTENRRVQKTLLPFIAAKLYISNLLWVTRKRAAACPSPGTDSPKLCSLEKSDSLQVQSEKVFPFPMWPGQCPFVCWQQWAQAGCWCSRSPSSLWLRCNGD